MWDVLADGELWSAAGPVLVLLVALLAAAGVMIRQLWKLFRLVSEHRTLPVQVAELKSALAEVKARTVELSENGGKSTRDRVIRIDERTIRFEQRLDGFDRRLAMVERRNGLS